MNIYIQNFVVQAEPCLDANGRQGYDVYYPDGRTHWMPVEDFEIHHRALDVRERMIMDMTSAEQLVMAVSDKSHINLEDPHYRPDVRGDMDFGPEHCAHVPPEGHIAGDTMYCAKCGALMP